MKAYVTANRLYGSMAALVDAVNAFFEQLTPSMVQTLALDWTKILFANYFFSSEWRVCGFLRSAYLWYTTWCTQPPAQ